MTFALVLGGGGTSGVAWQAGILKGLRDAGVDLTHSDLMVGTSAGAIVGASLASGEDIDALYARQIAPPPATPPRDVTALMRARAELQKPGDMTPLNTAALIRLGEMALAAPTESEESRLATVRSYLPADASWPDRALLITSIDVATGVLNVWSKDSDVPLLEAVASSCAAPMIAPPATINERRYMDAGVLSGTNAHLASGHDLVIVLAIMREGPGMKSHEIEKLRAEGARVEVVAPDARSAAAIFPNILDLTKRAAAAEAGRAQGSEIAAMVRSWVRRSQKNPQER
ncbi:MAG TPA: patatin-like phospholipase family protein [Terriglobia bacterium]|nr:patatin-like phospholipase family protein [Terriglobia bacterium]